VSKTALTRRRWLKRVAGVATVGSLSLGTTAAHADTTDEVTTIVGKIDRILPQQQLVLQHAQGRTHIKLSDTAVLSRGCAGRVAALAAFVAGEEIAVEGHWHGKQFLATSIMSVYGFIEGRIIQRQGDWLQTTAGALQLRAETRPRGGVGEDHDDVYIPKALDQLSVGDEIAAMVWNDPVAGTRVAVQIGVRGAA
jgi:hypothetical protein